MVWYWFLIPLVLGALWVVGRKFVGDRISPQSVLWLVGFAVVLLILGRFAYRSGQASATPSGAMDLSADLLTVNGKKVDIEDYSGKILFLNFWATWCGPCRMEMPSMARLYQQLNDKGLAMVALTEEDPETIRAYLEHEPYPFPILLDPDRTLFDRFGVYALPTTLVLDAEGRVLLEHTGGFRWDSPEVLDRFHKMLNE
jgi:thiol-disulfide isomerase/thioredoxin